MTGPVPGRWMPRLRGLALITALLAGAVPCVAAPADGRHEGTSRPYPRVLVLNAYHWGFGWTDAQVRGILQVLREGAVPPEVLIHDLDALRQPLGADDPLQVDFLRRRLGDGPVDVVIATDDPAIDFALKYRDALFPEAALVFSDARNVDVKRLPADLPVTGVLEHVDLMRSLAAVRTLMPDARRIIVFGNMASGPTGFSHAHEALLKSLSPLAIEQYFDQSLPEILARVAHLEPTDIVVCLGTALDEHGRRHDYDDVIARVAAVSRAPLVDITRQRVVNGISLGGWVEDGVAQGRTAAAMAQRVLEGVPARAIPVAEPQVELVFSYPVMQRYGLSERHLPKGAHVVGKPPGLLERAGESPGLVVALLAALSVVIAVLTVSLRRARRAEIELERKEEHLRLAVEGATDGIWDWNLATGSIYVSPRYFTMLGYAPGEFAPGYETWRAQVHPDDLAATEAVFNGFLRAGDGAYRSEFRMRAKDGRWRWILSRGAVAERGADGTPVRVAGSHTDITEAKLAEQRAADALHEKDVLLKEIYHRVKNNLQVVASLLTMEGRGVEDPAVRRIFDDSVARVMAMSQVHEQLYRSADLARIDFKRYLGQLVERLASQHGRKGVRIEAVLEDVRLGIETAIPCALIVNELVSNAVKHAFAPGQRGCIRVGLQAEGDAACLWVEDDGTGLPPDFSPTECPSLGWRLVEGLTNQIGGVLRLDSAQHGGSRISIRFRLAAPESRRYADALPA